MSNTVPFSKSECCGCSSCADVCPHYAINMVTDEEGFLYPVVDSGKCVECGLCLKYCAFHNAELHYKKASSPKAYIVKHGNQATRMNSRSGGVFVALSDVVLQKSGVVYGCVLTDDMRIVHIRATTSDDRNKMCKSKYAQSDTCGIFTRVEQDLKNGSFVLFSGTGCQVDGLLSFLKYKRAPVKNLYTVDIVCHGVASPMIFMNYIQWAEKKYKGKVTRFDFRDKTLCGWDGHIESLVIDNKKHRQTVYRELFHTDLALRESCYNCKYACINHSADITIADAWGIKQVNPSFNDNRGVSLVLVQSEKGKELFEASSDDCIIQEVPLEGYMQPNLIRPSLPKGNRKEFWDIYNSYGIEGLIKKYATIPLYRRILSRLKYFVRKIKFKDKYYLP